MSLPSETPNVVIPNADVRRWLGAALYIISVLTGIAALLFAYFPGLADAELTTSLIGFVNAAVSLVSGAFGLVVTLPNVPKSPTV